MIKKTRIWCSSPVTRSSFLKAAAVGSFVSLVMAPGLAAGAGTTLRQTVMAELKYDTNPGITPEIQHNQGGFVFVIAPGFELTNQRDKLRLTAAYIPSASYYFENTELNTISHSGTVSAEYTMSERTTFTLNELLNYSAESLETTQIGVQNQRGTILSNSLSFSVSHKLTQKTGISLSASDHMLDFEDPIAVDSRNDMASFGLNYQATPETQLNGSYNFSQVNYDLPSAASSSQNTHSVNAGFNTRFRDSLLLSISAGSVYVAPAGLNDGFYDWVATGEIRKSFQRSSASFSYTRQTTSASGLTDQISLNDSFIVGFNYELTRNVTMNLTGNYTHNYTKPDNTLDIKSLFAGLSADWRVYDWLSFGARCSHFKQQAASSLGDDLERNHVSINVNITTFERRL
jgi:hypothetical protein